MVIYFPILGRREQLWPHLPLQNTTTSDTSSVFLPKCWCPTKRGLPGPKEPGQGDRVHTIQPLHFWGRPVPRGSATGSAQHLPASPSNLPTIHTVGPSSCQLGRPWPLLLPSQGNSRVLSKDGLQIQVPPCAIPGPLSHTPLLTPGHPGVPTAPATPGGGSDHCWGARQSREEVLPQTSPPCFQGNGAGLSHRVACTFWELFLAPSNPKRGSLLFSAPWKPLQSCQPRGGEGAKAGGAEASTEHTGNVVVFLHVLRLRQGMRGKNTAENCL